MAELSTLQISDFRNLPLARIQPSSNFNIFYGDNGAGKTSILEAIYYFGFGRSFRTSNASRLIRETSDRFSLYSELSLDESIITLGIERSVDGGRRLRHNGENIKSIASVAEHMPIQLICTNSHRFFHDGPKLRRQFMNWGLFHVEHSFFPLWQQLLQLLKQRNAALKAHLSKAECSVWSTELITLSTKIDTLRRKYILQLQPILEGLTSIILEGIPLKLEYSPGWNSDLDYEQALNQAFFKDQAIGYTTVGPQRADLQILLEGKPAGDILSQGQQKLASYALLLAQGQLLKELSGTPPIYLIDDLPSELDPSKRLQINSILATLDAQVFITGITTEELTDSISLKNSYLFHVEHNGVERCS